MNASGCGCTRRGFSLIEMTAVIILVGVVLVFSATILHGGLRIERAGAAAFRQLMQRHELADQFRADVAEATGTPQAWEDFEAGPTCLILSKNEGHHVIYEWRDRRLRRTEWEGDEERRRDLPLEGDRLEVEFVRDGRLLTLRLTETRERGLSQVRDIAAALPGGAR